MMYMQMFELYELNKNVLKFNAPGKEVKPIPCLLQKIAMGIGGGNQVGLI